MTGEACPMPLTSRPSGGVEGCCQLSQNVCSRKRMRTFPSRTQAQLIVWCTLFLSSTRQLKNGVMLSKDGWKDRIKYLGCTSYEGPASRHTIRLPPHLSSAVALENPRVKKLINIYTVTAQERERGKTK